MKYLLNSALIIGLAFISCNNQGSSIAEANRKDSLVTKATAMKCNISIFEIPATEISRAIDFYQAILNIEIEKMDMPGMQMGILPYEEQMVTGVIVQGEGYKPSAEGVTIYLNGGENLQIVLDRVEAKGGKIMVPKTSHGDENGYFALFLDTEGNKIGLHSPN